jgi:hypothetical protein
MCVAFIFSWRSVSELHGVVFQDYLAYRALSGSKRELAIVCYELQGSVLFQVRLNQPKTRHRKLTSCFGHSAQLLHEKTLRQIILKAAGKAAHLSERAL